MHATLQYMEYASLWCNIQYQTDHAEHRCQTCSFASAYTTYFMSSHHHHINIHVKVLHTLRSRGLGKYICIKHTIWMQYVSSNISIWIYACRIFSGCPREHHSRADRPAYVCLSLSLSLSLWLHGVATQPPLSHCDLQRTRTRLRLAWFVDVRLGHSNRQRRRHMQSANHMCTLIFSTRFASNYYVICADIVLPVLWRSGAARRDALVHVWIYAIAHNFVLCAMMFWCDCARMCWERKIEMTANPLVTLLHAPTSVCVFAMLSGV